jgi:signal peptidase I
MAAAGALVLVIRAWMLTAYHVPSASMEPALHCARPAAGCQADSADRVVAARFMYRLRDPRRGDIVVFWPTPTMLRKCGVSGAYVKRIIGLPGETVQQRGGQMFVNGRPLSETYLKRRASGGRTTRVHTVAVGQYYVVGDNRADSCDSRQTDTVPRGSLIGPVVFTYWPLDRVGP